MKYKVIVTALAMAFIMVMPCVSVGSESDAGSYEDYHPAYDSLSNAQKTLYDDLHDAVDKFKTSVKVSGLTLEEAEYTYHAFSSDFPEYYWFEDTYSTYYNPDTGMATDIKSKGPIDSDKMLKGLEEITENIKKKVNITGTTTAERLQSAQQSIAYNVVYDKTTESCGNIYGAFVEGKAKCDGYSAAFQVLCKALDVPCVTFTGDVIGEGKHAWNAVRMDNGKWYYVDATWDDSKCPEMVDYDYFLIGSKTDTPTGTFIKNRTIDRDFGVEVSTVAYTFDPYPDGYWTGYFSASYEALSKQLKDGYYYWWYIHDVQFQVDESARKALTAAMLRYGSEKWYVSVRTYESSTPIESKSLKDFEVRMYLDDSRIISLSSLGLDGLIKFVPPALSSEPNYEPEYYSLDGTSFDRGDSMKLKDLDRFTVGYVERDHTSLLIFAIIIAIAIVLIIVLRARAARKSRAAYQAYAPRQPSSDPSGQQGRPIGYCPQCGASVQSEDVFCKYCGKMLNESQSSQNDDKTN